MMYIVIVGNEIVGWHKTFKRAYAEATNHSHLNGWIPVYIAKLIVKDGVTID